MFYVKVKMQDGSTVYLELAKLVEGKSLVKAKSKYIMGSQINRDGESVMQDGGTITHLIEIGDGVTLWVMEFDKFYGHMKVDKSGTKELRAQVA